jgi:hypothetical protein
MCCCCCCGVAEQQVVRYCGGLEMLEGKEEKSSRERPRDIAQW